MSWIAFFLAMLYRTSGENSQLTLSLGSPEMSAAPAQWDLSLSSNWDVLGPFPIQAREQHYLSPAYPLELKVPYVHEGKRIWPSSYADGAFVSWTKAHSDSEGNLNVSFPNVRWSYLRSSEGWDALQYHSVLHTTFNVTIAQIYPPRKAPRLRVELQQGSFFTILPREDTKTFTPEWHTGNIYGLRHASNNTVELPSTVKRNEPTTFDLFVSGDYEIRLFGDPRDRGDEMPTLRLKIQISSEDRSDETVIREETHDVVCDFVDGFAFGDALGVGLRSLDDWWTVQSILPSAETSKALALSLQHSVTLAPGQTRIVPIQIGQTSPLEGNKLSFTIYMIRQNNIRLTVPVTITFVNLTSGPNTPYENIRATYFYAMSHPTHFIAKLPEKPHPERSAVPILALHGAGVDVVNMPFWADAIPRQRYSWVIMPTGRTEWGLDWHIASARDAWSTVAALSAILNRRWSIWSFDPETKVMLMGHSNGGQGVWHLAVHYPDRVHAAIAAAGFMNAQAYVPIGLSRGGRFIDPMLKAVLESAFTADNNELFLGNIAHTVPLLAIHGGNDSNVPAWHTREYVSSVLSWHEDAPITFIEDKGQSHWYSNLFSRRKVQHFINKALDRPQKTSPRQFTLTVHDPSQFGTLHGWSIDSVLVPGRIARLQVSIGDKVAYVRTSNVNAFSLHAKAGDFEGVIVNGMPVSGYEREGIEGTFVLDDRAAFAQVKTETAAVTISPPGRVQNVFDTTAALTVVIPSDLIAHPRLLSAAQRIAHNIDVYLKLDSEIILDTAAVKILEKAQESSTFQGNVIILGGPENALSRYLLGDKETRRKSDFSLTEDGKWLLRDQLIDDSGEESLGLIFTHPHPMNRAGMSVVIAGTDDEAFERALRLFPIRTGIAVPDWVIIGKDAERRGMGGVVGAGLWNGSWRWSEAMSYLSM